jgi:hypothetical protein
VFSTVFSWLTNVGHLQCRDVKQVLNCMIRWWMTSNRQLRTSGSPSVIWWQGPSSEYTATFTYLISVHATCQIPTIMSRGLYTSSWRFSSLLFLHALLLPNCSFKKDHIHSSMLQHSVNLEMHWQQVGGGNSRKEPKQLRQELPNKCRFWMAPGFHSKARMGGGQIPIIACWRNGYPPSVCLAMFWKSRKCSEYALKLI